jgi:hypothetical protein
MTVIHADVGVPVRIESSLNLREHWRLRANRNSSHRAAAYFSLKAVRFSPSILPCVCTITRIAPRELDDDNLAGGCKSVRDGVADWLGIDDRDPRVQWRYAQAKGKPHEYAARVTLTAAEV